MRVLTLLWQVHIGFFTNARPTLPSNQPIRLMHHIARLF
nr:MAG TPA: hypothetical protein [Caudoviricetes sp.]